MTSVDERVVSIKLKDDNFQKGVDQILKAIQSLKKELKFNDTTKDFAKLDKAVKGVKFDSMAKSASDAQRSVSKMTSKAEDDFSKMGSSAEKSFNQVSDAASKVDMSDISDSATEASRSIGKMSSQAAENLGQVGAAAQKSFAQVEDSASRVKISSLSTETDQASRSFSSLAQSAADAFAKISGGRINLTPAIDAVTKLKAGFDQFSTEHMQREISAVNQSFNSMQVAGIAALGTIVSKATEAGMQIANQLTAGMRGGLEEYNTQMTSIQTILANTQKEGTNINQVNGALNTLNTYADQTIYNFGEMARNIGTFTAAGVKLQTSVDSIKGIANLAAVSGSSSAQASTAMYQLSQAIAAGKVQLMDWNSVVNAGMGGQVFQDALTRTSNHLHDIGKEATSASAAINEYGSFRESLTKGEWLTTQVLTETLKQLSGAYTEADLRAQGYTEEQAKAIVQMAETAQKAATQIKTFSQLMDTAQEEVGSGWAQTWQIVFGDFEEARTLWTEVGNAVQNFIGNQAKARNDLLRSGLSTGYKQLLNEGIADTNEFSSRLQKIAQDSGANINEMIDKYGSFEAGIGKSWKVTGDQIKQAVNETADSMNNLTQDQRREKGITQEQIDEMNKLRDRFNSSGDAAEEFAEKMNRASGRENIIEGLRNIVNAILPLTQAIGDAWRDVFPAMTGEQLYDITVAFRKFTETLKPSPQTIEGVRVVAKALFTVLKFGVNIVKAVAVVIGALIYVVAKIAVSFFTAIGAVSLFIQKMAELLKIKDNFKKIQDGATAMQQKVSDAFAKSGISDKFSKSLADARAELERFAINLSDAFGKSDFMTSFLNGWNAAVDGVVKMLSPLGDLIDGVMIGSLRAMADQAGKAQNIMDGLGDAFEFAGQQINRWGTEVQDAFQRKFGDIPTIAQNVCNGIKRGFEALDPVFQVVKKAIDKVGEVVHTFFADLNGNITVDQILSVINGGFLLALLKNANKLIKGFMEASDDAESFTDKIDGVLKKVGDSFKEFQDTMSIGKLILIAGAIWTLSDALYNLAQLDIKQIGTGLAGLGAVTTLLGGFITVLGLLATVTKKGGGKMFNIGAVSEAATGIIAIAAAMYLIAKAANQLKGMDPQEVAVIFGALAGMMIALASSVGIIATSIGKINPKTLVLFESAMKSIALLFVGIGASMVLIAVALEKISSLKPEALAQSVTALATLVAVIGGTVVLIGKFGGSMSSSLGAMEQFGVAMLAIGAAMVLMAGALKILSTMNVQQSITAVGSLSVLIGLIGGMMALMGKYGVWGNQMAAFGKTMIEFGAALTLMAVAIKIVGSMKLQEAVQGFGLLGLVMTTMVVAMKALDSANFEKSSLGLIALAAALNMLVIPISILGVMPFDNLAKGLGTLVVSMMAMAVVMKHLDSVDSMKSAAGILALAAAMNMLVVPITVLGAMSWETLTKGLLGFITIIGTLAGVSLIVSGIGTGILILAGAVGILGVGLLAAGAGVTMLAAGLLTLSAAGSAATGIITAMITAVVNVIPVLVKSIANALVMSLAVIAAATPQLLQSIGKMLDAIIPFIVSRVPQLAEAALTMVDQVLASLAAHSDSITESLVTIFVNALHAVANHMPEFLDATGDILNALMTAIGTAVKTANPSAISNLIITMGAMAVLFKLMAGMKKDVKDALIVGGSMELLLLGMVGIFFAMSQIDPESQIATGQALLKVMIGLGAMATLLGEFQGKIVKAVAAGAAMEILMLGLVGIFTLMQGLNPEGVVANAQALTLALVGIGAGALILANAQGNILKAVVAGAAMELLMLGLVGIFTLMNGIDAASAQTNAVTLVGTMAAIGLLVAAMSLIPVAAAVSGVASLAVAIGGITAIIVAMGALKQIPGFNWLVSEGGSALVAVGNAIGGFVGSIVGGALEQISSSLVETADNLSDFMTHLQPFLTGAQSITPESMEGVKSLSSVILTLTAAGLLDAITSFIGGGGSSLSTFGDQLAQFGPKIKAYGDAVAGTDTASIQASAAAAKAMVEVAQAIPNEGGFLAKFSGDNTLGQFAEGLVPFGDAMRSYGVAVAGLDTAAITASASAAQSIVDMANTVGNSGGVLGFFMGENDLGAFGENLKSFGTALSSYGISVADLDAAPIVSSARAAQAIVNMANTLQNSGGVLAFFTGDNDLGTFGNQLKSFGSAMSSYASTVGGIDFEAINGVTSAAKKVANMLNSLAGQDYSNVDAFKTAVSKLGEVNFGSIDTSLSDTASKIGTSLTNLNNAISSQVEPINASVNSLKIALNNTAGIGGTVTSSLNSIASSVSSSRGSIVSAFNGIASTAQGFSGQMSSALSGVPGVVSGKMAQVVQSVNDKKATFANAGRDLANALKQGLTQAANGMGDAFRNPLQNAVQTARSYHSNFYNAGSYLVSGFASGIRDNVQSAANAAASMAKAASEAANKNLKIESPSRVMMKTGRFFTLGFAQGITDNESSASAASVKMASNSVRAFNDALSAIAIDDIDLNPTITPVLDLSNVKAGSAEMESLFADTPIATSLNVRKINPITLPMKTDPTANQQNATNAQPQNVYNMTQNNYSPKALNTTTIYRQTRNQFAALKEGMNSR